MSTQSQTSVLKLYHSVIEDVIAGVRDAFLDEGVDEQVLQELKQTWEAKLISSKALELNTDPPEPQPPQITQKNNIAGKPMTLGGFPSTSQGPHAQMVQQVSTQLSNAQPQPMSSVVQQQGQQLQQQSGTTAVTTQQQNAVQQPQQTTTLITTDPNKQVPIHITLPAQAGVPDSQPRVLTIHVPASALQGNQLHAVLTGPIISATMALPQRLASSLLQQHVTAALQGQAASGAGQLQQIANAALAAAAAASQQSAATNGNVITQNRQGFQQTPGTIRQLDGMQDTSDEEDDDDEDDDMDDDDENDDKDDDENEEENDGGGEEEPLNSEDDVSDEDPTDLFDTDNVVVCQYDKITRARNKWKFYLKDGIMNLSGKDYVFQKANGDAEW